MSFANKIHEPDSQNNRLTGKAESGGVGCVTVACVACVTVKVAEYACIPRSSSAGNFLLRLMNFNK